MPLPHEAHVSQARLILSRDRERLLSFSYPCGLPSGPEGSLLVERLHLTLSTRLAAAQAVHPELEGAQIEVEERMVVLDQVAL